MSPLCASCNSPFGIFSSIPVCMGRAPLSKWIVLRHTQWSCRDPREQTIGALITKQTAALCSYFAFRFCRFLCARTSNLFDYGNETANQPLTLGIRPWYMRARARADNESASNFVTSTWMRILSVRVTRSERSQDTRCNVANGEDALTLLSHTRDFHCY